MAQHPLHPPLSINEVTWPLRAHLANLVVPNRRVSGWILRTWTRSQAVARLADRTTKNCRGHVT